MDDAGHGRRGLRPHASPPFDAAVEDAYGISLADATDLGGSANLNLVARAGTRSFVVRAYRKHVTGDRLRAIQRARSHLAARGVPSAEPVRTREGEPFLRVGDHLVEVEPFIGADSDMDSLELVAAGLPTLGRVHDLLDGLDLGSAAQPAPFSNFVDPVGLVAAVRLGTDRIRSWQPTAEEIALAVAADRLAEAAAVAYEPYLDLPRQLAHGDFWDNNVRFRGGKVVLVADFDFMGERHRVDDLALTLFCMASSLGRPLDPPAWRELAALVDRYDRGTSRPLTATERAALPVAVARQPLWSIAVWAAQLDDAATTRRHLVNHRAAVEQGRTIIADLDRYQ